MDGSRLSPYPHLSWFAFGLTIRSPRVFLLHEYRAVTHRLMVTEEGDAHLAWATGAANETCRVTVGSLVFLPGDSARHSIGITAPEGYRGHEVLVPIRHLESVCEAEGVGHMTDSRLHSVFRDTLLSACVLRLLAGSVRGHLAEDVGTEIAARQAIMRLAVLGGGRPPAWRKDASTFPPRVMTLIVERVDAHLKAHPSLEVISSGFGLSPSHFARKFQHSTGLSLNRFINRRRIGLSLASLKTGGMSLAQLSLDLGFSSQSHFTRLFSSLVGVTPHQFRRTQRRNDD